MSIFFEQTWRGDLVSKQDFFRSALMTGCQDFLHGLTVWKGLSGVQDGAQSLSYCIQRVHSHSLRSRDELGCSARLGREAALNAHAGSQGAAWKGFPPKTADVRLGKSMRVCYSVDFGPAGKLKREGGSLRVIILHNCRSLRLAGANAQDGANSDAEARRGQEMRAILEAEMAWKENIDSLRIGIDQIWFNPAYGHGDGIWASSHDLPVALNAEPERPVMDAIQVLLGIEDVDGVLRYGEGSDNCGGRCTKPDVKDKSKWRRKATKAVRHDAVLTVDVILHVSSLFFFPKRTGRS